MSEGIEQYLNKITCGDCLEVMKKLPDKCVDLVLTDPPYNIRKDFANDNLPLNEYLTWCDKWIAECERVLKWGGAIWVTLGFQTVAEVKIIFNRYPSLRLKNWIIWYRQDGWKGDKGFSQSHEHILYFIKDNYSDEFRSEFGNYVREKRKAKGYTTRKCREMMGLPVYDSCGNAGKLWFETGEIPTQSEYELMKDVLGLDNRYDKQIRPDYIKFFPTNVCDDVWLNPKSEKNRLGHPTQKPIPLFRRIIEVSTNEGDTVVDCFTGSGTTAVACKQLNRNFIGIEISPEYCAIAEERLKNLQPTLL